MRRNTRVLVLANRLPYPVDDGWKTRTFHVIGGLARRASVTLLSFHDGPDATARGLEEAVGGDLTVTTVPPPRSHTPDRLLLGLTTPTPVYVWNMRSRAFRRALDRLVAEWEPDLAVAELTYLYPYLRSLPRSVLRVVDTHNIDSVVLQRYSTTLPSRLRRLYAAATASKLRRYEASVFGDADHVWVCSEREADLVGTMTPEARVRVVPNGVDTRAFAPPPDVSPIPQRLLFFGRMDYQPNRDGVQFFASEMLPDLRQKHPGLELEVVGAGIGSDLRSLARETPGLRLVGRVDDLRPVLAAAGVVVVPLRMGGGTRLKILEALSMARPVVSTTVGAEGLHVRPGEDLLIADSADAFVEAIDRLVSDAALRERLGSRGRRTVREQYDWAAIQEEAISSLGRLPD